MIYQRAAVIQIRVDFFSRAFSSSLSEARKIAICSGQDISAEAKSCMIISLFILLAVCIKKHGGEFFPASSEFTSHLKSTNDALYHPSAVCECSTGQVSLPSSFFSTTIIDMSIL